MLNKFYYKNINIESLTDEELSKLFKEIKKELNIRLKRFNEITK